MLERKAEWEEEAKGKIGGEKKEGKERLEKDRIMTKERKILSQKWDD